MPDFTQVGLNDNMGKHPLDIDKVDCVREIMVGFKVPFVFVSLEQDMQ